MRFLERKCISRQKCWCPNNFSKNDPSWAKTALFGLLVEALPPLRWGAPSPWEIGRSTQNYKRKWAFLKKMYDGLRYGGLMSRLRDNIDQQLGNGISQKGQKLPPKKFQQLFGFKIKRRSRFYHQTRPYSNVWPSYGCSKLNVRKRQKGMIII